MPSRVQLSRSSPQSRKLTLRHPDGDRLRWLREATRLVSTRGEVLMP
jgi:hypothetical protein